MPTTVKPPVIGARLTVSHSLGFQSRPNPKEIIAGANAADFRILASTQLMLFSNYLDHPQNIRVNWDNRFMWKVAKFFSLNLITNLIYDDKVLVVTEKYPEGHKAIQFYEALQFGFTYTFASKK